MSQRVLPFLDRASNIDKGEGDGNELAAAARLSPRQALLQQRPCGEGLSVDTAVVDKHSGASPIPSVSLLRLRDEETTQDEDHPKSFICPISGAVMHDPVVLPDGHTYERKYIERWLGSNEKKTSPMTGAELPHETANLMFPNYALRNAIEEYFAIVFSVHRRAIRLAAAATPPLSPISPLSPAKEDMVRPKPAAKAAKGDRFKRSDFESNAALLRTIDGLMECSIMMNSDLTTETIIHRIMDEAKQLVGAECASVFLVDDETHELFSTVNSTGQEIRIPMSAGIAGLVATSGTPVLIPEAYKDSRFNKSVDLKTGFQTRNILCVPIKTRSGHVLGVTQLINKATGGVISDSRDRCHAGDGDGLQDGATGGDDGNDITFTEDDQRFLEVFASQAAAAIYSSGMLELKQTRLTPSSSVSESIAIDETKAAEVKELPSSGDTTAVKYVGVPGVHHVPRRTKRESKATQTDAQEEHAESKQVMLDKPRTRAEPKATAEGDTGVIPAAPANPTAVIIEDIASTAEKAHSNGDPVRIMLDAAFNSYEEFDALALAQLTEGHPLSTLGQYLFTRLGLNEAFGIDPAKLSNFLCAIEAGYDDGTSIPYHNRAHAASVMHMTHAAMHLGGASKMVGTGNWFRPWLQAGDEVGAAEDTTTTGGTNVGAFETLACLLAAAIHDFEHLGMSNDILIKTDSERAVQFNDRSVNENHHVAAAYAVMRQPQCNFLETLPRQDYLALRQLVIELVLSTDMANHKEVVDGLKEALNKHTTKAEKLAHAQAVREMEAWREVDKQAQVLRRAKEAGEGEKQGQGCAEDTLPTTTPKLVLQRVSPGLPCNQDQDDAINAANSDSREEPPFSLVAMEPYVVASKLEAFLMLKMVLKCADVGHLALPWEKHLVWCQKLEEEFFKQGDLEKALDMSPSFLMDRDKPGVTKTQVGFFDFIVLPLFRSLTEALPGTAPVLNQVQANYAKWVALDSGKPGEEARGTSSK